MARPRIFLSSTFYDLRQVRADLQNFIKEIGYEAVLNESGNIAYGKEESLQEYCYKEIANIDILVSIIGGRFGSESNKERYSVSQAELTEAIKSEKQVYIFIENSVYSEFGTYKKNKSNKDINYNYVDDKRVYEFIEQIESLPKNNPISTFETSLDII